MTKPVSTGKKSRKQYFLEFRDDALKLAEYTGTTIFAGELNRYESQIHSLAENRMYLR